MLRFLLAFFWELFDDWDLVQLCEFQIINNLVDVIHIYKKIFGNSDKADDKKLVALYKIFSPAHLLKLPFANDSNQLDKAFYAELLHIIGLEETSTYFAIRKFCSWDSKYGNNCSSRCTIKDKNRYTGGNKEEQVVETFTKK